jgi:SpoVK/Ycf46/Vps4 family AAA+-type ATPase
MVSPAAPGAAFLATLPVWGADLVRAIWAKQANVFVLHGMPADLVPVDAAGGLRFLALEDFLQQELFAAWPSFLTYNRAEGIGFGSTAARGHFQDRLRTYDAVHGTTWSQALPRDALNSFALLDSYFRSCAAQAPARPVVLVLPFAETMAPAAEAAYRTPEDRAVVVYLRRWAQDPVLLAKNVVLVLITESLADLDPQLRRAHAAREIEIQRPGAADRLAFLEAARPAAWYAQSSELPAAQLAQLTAGMNRVQLGQLLDGIDANGETLSRARVRLMKKEVIETEGLGLLEYVEPPYDLSMVAGMAAVKDRLRRVARAIARGNTAAVPMGYLVCGPVGSAKTFLVECFAKEIGIPCVKLKNFRSMWVGSTESNLERILKILSALTPVGVVVDEADAALGNREAQGDSGTQNRVFAEIAAFMGDTRHRGQILWFLITARPDLLPIDLKRQGRAEEHIPLFYPETAAEYDEIYQVMLKKLGIRTPVARLSEVTAPDQLLGLSGSDLEAVLVRAALEAAAADCAEVSAEHLRQALADFIPAANSLEREMQVLCAVLESTSRALLPAAYRDLDRAAIQARLHDIRRELRLT